MKIGVIGDIHGDYDLLDSILENSECDIYLQVGDFAGEKSYYPDLEKRVFFVRGNHECFDVLNEIDKPTEICKNLIYIPNSTYVVANDIKIGSFGGNFSPVSFWKERKELSGKRRAHITVDEFQNALKMKDIDILLTHEAPSPFIIRDHDVGLSIITSLLFALRPKFHFFGHHHVDKCSKICDTFSCCVKTFKEIDFDV